jgi:hypothetical protein
MLPSLAVGPGETACDGLDQVIQTPRGVSVGKEQRRILVEVRRRALEHLAEVRRKVLVADPALQHISARPAELIDGGRAHGVVSFTSAA